MLTSIEMIPWLFGILVVQNFIFIVYILFFNRAKKGGQGDMGSRGFTGPAGLTGEPGVTEKVFKSILNLYIEKRLKEKDKSK